MIVLEGKPQKPLNAHQLRVHAVLKNAGAPLSPLGITRWAMSDADAVTPDANLTDAAESLWLGGYIQKYRDGTFSIED